MQFYSELVYNTSMLYIYIYIYIYIYYVEAIATTVTDRWMMVYCHVMSLPCLARPTACSLVEIYRDWVTSPHAPMHHGTHGRTALAAWRRSAPYIRRRAVALNQCNFSPPGAGDAPGHEHVGTVIKQRVADHTSAYRNVARRAAMWCWKNARVGAHAWQPSLLHAEPSRTVAACTITFC